MKTPNSPGALPVHKGTPLPTALFKSTLRDWRAAYRARQPAQAVAAEKGIQPDRAR